MKKGTGPDAILIIGVGNSYRSDDGIGIEIARSIAVRTPAEVHVIEQTGEGAALMDSWKGAAAVILIDATSSGSPPGTVHRFDVHSAPIPSKYFHYSTHAFSVAEAIELARTLKLLPPVMIVYGIEGKNFNAGTEISIPVRRSAGRVEADILADIDTVLKQ